MEGYDKKVGLLKLLIFWHVSHSYWSTMVWGIGLFVNIMKGQMKKSICLDSIISFLYGLDIPYTIYKRV